MKEDVKVWVEKIIIPTYNTGNPEINPLFLENRVYQGSSGVVYPFPVIESIENVKTNKEYTAVFLENEFLKIMILPELGGRIQRAYDKVKQRDFVYYNEVIKPALVGLTGPWISGGIEFNWPQHHRPSTFSPLDFKIENNIDGSKTIWINEIELMTRTKGLAGFTLYPNKAYLEIKGELFNRTTFPQTFLWWANPAVKVNDYYQSIFPPDVYAVFDHGKRDVSDFPIATGTYYKVDFSNGTDISRFKNIPVPMSYMAIHSKYDFIGCYEHDTEGGMLHISNHHISPGKKQWTWGNGDFGKAWDINLTDENGPYIELMTGVFTDNQPDFTWLKPNENKSFEQYFMPYSSVGNVKNASKDAILNVDFNEDNIIIKVYTTAVHDKLCIQLINQNILVKQYFNYISPYKPFDQTFTYHEIKDKSNWRIIVFDDYGNELVSYQYESISNKEVPSAATAPKAPKDIEHVEELYLNGLHIEQYRHPTYNAIDYYNEGLKRDPSDSRCNNAMGLYMLRRGQFVKAESYFRSAINTITQRNPNPYNGDSFYYLGISLKYQGKLEDAYKAFYKSIWNDEWQHSGFLELARIDTKYRNWNISLDLINKSLLRNYNNSIARHLKSIILRKLHKYNECNNFITQSLTIDPFNFGCLFETYILSKQYNHEIENNQIKKNIFDLMHNSENNFLELSLDYANAGLYEEAIQVIELLLEFNIIKTALPYYYIASFHIDLERIDIAQRYLEIASNIKLHICFPNKLEEVKIFSNALLYNSKDALGNLYLGNLWYDKRQYNEAIQCWERSIGIDDKIATTFRNLSLAYYNKLKLKDKAILYLEKAFSLNQSDGRILMELDQLHKITGKSNNDRLFLLESHLDLVESRDDIYLERVTIYNNLGQFKQARNFISNRQFHPWEGGEGKVVTQFLVSTFGLAILAMESNNNTLAVQYLLDCFKYPINLGEGKLYGTYENDKYYLLGCAYENMGQLEKAISAYEKASIGHSELGQAVYYNDVQPDKLFFQALALRKLKKIDLAVDIFNRFSEYANDNMNKKPTIDYFAVSLPDMLVFDMDLELKNLIHCKYLLLLSYLGLGDFNFSKKYIDEIIQLDCNHQGAINFKIFFNFYKKQIN